MSAPDPLTFLERLQADLGARLESKAFFQDIPVLVARKGQIESDVEVALTTFNAKAGRGGAVSIVLMPTLEVPEAEAPGPQFVVSTTVRCVENPLVNLDVTNGGTGKSAESLGLVVLRAMHHFDLGDGHVLYADRRAMEPNGSFEGQVAYDVHILARSGLDPEAQTATPTLSLTNGATAVQMVCTTPAAAIFYTLDGSFPWSGNPAATLYADPFPLPAAPATLRAAAYTEGLDGSTLTQLNLD